MLLTPITRLNAIPLLESNSQMPAEAQRLEWYIFMMMIQMNHPRSASTHCCNDQTGKIRFSSDWCCSLFFRQFTRRHGKAVPLTTNSHPLQTISLDSKPQLSASAAPALWFLPLSSSSISGDPWPSTCRERTDAFSHHHAAQLYCPQHSVSRAMLQTHMESSTVT